MMTANNAIPIQRINDVNEERLGGARWWRRRRRRRAESFFTCTNFYFQGIGEGVSRYMTGNFASSAVNFLTVSTLAVFLVKMR